MRRLFPASLLIILLSTVTSVTWAAEEELLSYNRDIRTILSENCFFCHGFDKNTREADLRLDTFEGATSKKAIIPGDPANSELVKRIHHHDPDLLMPPPQGAYVLSPTEKATLEKWIEQGAKYQDHWAYTAVEQPEVPAHQFSSHPVDSFLARKWKQKNVTPVDEAEPRTLLRRLSYDLRGLPPTAAEVQAFQSDPSPAHYQRKVEEYLSSLAHAENQALRWLDLVRHADSNGMVSDEPIASGPYRKWVIEQFQKNTPFDDFTRAQLAGDLLDQPSDDDLIASAYNRLVKTNAEAGVIEKEALYALKGEHVRALGTVWLGSTIACAECHDHKYDPITAADYYNLASFFDPLIEVGVYEPGDRRVPVHYLHDREQDTQIERELTAKTDELRQKLYFSELDRSNFEQWKSDLLAEEKAAKQDKEHHPLIWFPAQLPLAWTTEGNYQRSEQGRTTTAPDGEISRHLCGESVDGFIKGPNHGFFTDVTLDPQNFPKRLYFQALHGAYRRLGWHADYRVTYYWGEKYPENVAFPEFVSPEKLVYLGPLPKEALSGQKTRLTVLKKQFKSAPYNIQGLAWAHEGGQVTWGDSGYFTSKSHVLQASLTVSARRFFWELPLNRDDRKDLPGMLLRALKMRPADQRNIHRTVIDVTFREHQQPELTAELTEHLRKTFLFRRNATPTLVSKDGLTGSSVKETRVLNRGNFMDESGPKASPQILSHFGKLEKANPNRLDLANWIVSADNPLTARVFVNRLWHQYYGRGLSESLEDVGSQGDWPSHPDLLNYLAAEFQKDWDIKRLIRLLVTSRAYRLSSIPGSSLAQKDPTNRLHARQSRFRLTGEEIRDTALQAAGLLHCTSKNEIPVASFFPYQPEPYWNKSNKVMYGSRYQIWETAQDEAQYQRSLYAYRKRQNIHPGLLAFDSPTRQECSARRANTNSPAQALALLNAPQFTEAARVLAAKALELHPTKTDRQKIFDHLFQQTLQRPATESETTELLNLQKTLLAHYKSQPTEAESLLKVGQHRTKTENPAQLAAWTATTRVLLNLHEFITRS